MTGDRSPKSGATATEVTATDMTGEIPHLSPCGGTSTLRSEKWARVLEGALALGGVGLLGFLLFQLAWYRFGMDQAILAVVGDGLLQGELPYRDRWSMRTPGIYLFYAAGQLLFGKTMMAVRLVEAGALLSLFVAFPVISRRFVGSAVPGFVGALLATLTHVQLGYWNTGQSDSFGGVVLAWAVLSTTWQPDTRRAQFAAWITSGALFTFAAMLRPPLGGGFVLCLVLLVRARYRAHDGQRPAFVGRSGLLEPILAFGAGGAIVVATALLPYVVSGAVSDLVWTYRDVVPGYAAVIRKDLGLLPGVYRAGRDLLFGCSPYLFPGLVLWALLPPLGRRERAGVLYLSAAVAPQLLGVSLQAKFFLHHIGGMVHLVALWSAWGYFKLWRRVRRRPVWAMLLLVAVVAVHDVVKPEVWRHSGQRWEAFRNREQRAKILDRLEGGNAAAMRRVSKWIESNTAPDARVLVWGTEAAIYFRSDRRPASRFVTNFVLRFPWSAARAREILRQEIEATPPAVIVVSSGDALPWATRDRLDSAQALLQVPWLRDLLRTRYRRVEHIGKLAIYRLGAEGRPPKRRPPT